MIKVPVTTSMVAYEITCNLDTVTHIWFQINLPIVFVARAVFLDPVSKTSRHKSTNTYSQRKGHILSVCYCDLLNKETNYKGLHIMCARVGGAKI